MECTGQEYNRAKRMSLLHKVMKSISGLLLRSGRARSDLKCGVATSLCSIAAATSLQAKICLV